MTSIIITAYNYDRYLERAIRSALNQSLPRHQFEVIVVNDASVDRTKEILDNYEDELRVFNLETNVGLAAARNFGLRKSKGQFVVFLDADDFIHKDLLLVQKMFLEENNYIDAIAVDYHFVDERGIHRQMISSKNKPIACGIMFRKDQLFDIGLYDPEFLAREEEELMMRFKKEFKVTHIPIPLYRYRMHDSNMTKNDELMDLGKEKLEKKHGNS